MNKTITITIASKFISHISLALLILFIGGCGGSSSDSGGLSNIFIGKQEVSVTQSRITSDLRATEFLLIREGGQITISDQEFTISAQLSGSEFIVTSPEIPILNPDSSCSSFSVTYSGTITESMVVGKINGAYNCVLPASLNGSFEASNQTRSTLPALPSVSSIVVGG